ncbi:amino acid permease [Clostridium sp. BJN0013]|uniref:amino acid permease n=1 Tax=Clostridium sp. BJN0013 TaxID=3236840 RepID=UPI0034C5F498
MEKRHKGLSVLELTMMALGTVIGGSFFLGSSVAIHTLGPFIIISYVLGGILVYFILSALSEMTVADPSPGSFFTYARKAFGSGAGFIVGWVYWTGMVLAMSSEAAAVSILLRRWFPGISISFFGSMTILVITLLNLLGADKLSKLESGLAAVKLLAIVSFIIIALLLITGLLGLNPGVAGVKVRGMSFLLPGGIKSIAGSMLTVMFAYAGFEIIGLAASETDNPQKMIPKAIKYTVLSLVVLYIASISAVLLLIPTEALGENVSPMVAALNRWGMNWAGNVINIVMVIAILSTMLAAMFGIGRMIRSLADEVYAPGWLKDNTNIPYRGMMFSGAAMFLGLMMGLLFPRVYLFLVSCGGFSLLFTYIMIVASQIRLRKKHMYIIEEKQHSYISWITAISLIAIILSMPFIPGQASGLIAGIVIIVFYSVVYIGVKYYVRIKKYVRLDSRFDAKERKANFFMEFSKELVERKKVFPKRKGKKYDK